MFLPRDLLDETRANKKTPIWRFIPLSPRDGEEGASTGTNYTFTQKTIYHLGIWLSMCKLGRAAEHFEDLPVPLMRGLGIRAHWMPITLPLGPKGFFR